MAEPTPPWSPGPPAWLFLLLPCWTLAARCADAMALQLPSITILQIPAEPPSPGKSVTVSCEATSELPELTLLYWLGNGSFVESLHPKGAVREGTTQEELQGSGVALRRDLHFSSFDTQHLHTNFTCVVLSPLGVDTREVQWPLPAPARHCQDWGTGLRPGRNSC